MNKMLLSAGLACIIAAVVGGGLRAWGIEIPGLKSVARQTLLGLFGIAFLALAYIPSVNAVKATQNTVPVSSPAVTGKSPVAAATPADSPVNGAPKQAAKLTTLQLTYIGGWDKLRGHVNFAKHTPNNNNNRGDCPYEIGHKDGKWCTSRTPLTITVLAPSMLKEATVNCTGDPGCQFTAGVGTSTVAISPDGLTATGYLDNWGWDVEAELTANEYQRILAPQCGIGQSKQVASGTTATFTVLKECVPIATLAWTLPDGSQGAAAVDKVSPTERVCQVGAPLDRGNELVFTYKIY